MNGFRTTGKVSKISNSVAFIRYDVKCSLLQLSQSCSTEKYIRFGLKWMLSSCSASKNSRGTKFWCLYLRHQPLVPRLFFDAEHDASIHFNPKRIYFSVEQFCES
eukprot:sb/3477949/